MSLISKIKKAGTASELQNTKNELDRMIIRECFTINGTQPDNDKYEYVKIQDGFALFDFTGTNYEHKGVDIEINFKKWEQYSLPKHIKFNLSIGYLKFDFDKFLNFHIKGFTFEEVDPDANGLRFDILGPAYGFNKTDFIFENCTFITNKMVICYNTQRFQRKKYYNLTNKGKFINGKLDEDKKIIPGLKKVLFNGTNKFDVSLLNFRDFGVGIESEEIGNTNNKWYDYIISKYTPGTKQFIKRFNNCLPEYSLSGAKFPFNLAFHRLMDKIIREDLIGGTKSIINIGKIDIEDYLDRDNQGILYVR